MNVLTKKCLSCLLIFMTLCFLLSGCSPKKEFKFHFFRKNGETYIQKLSTTRERQMGPADVQTDDTLTETRVICKKTKDGWDIESRPINAIMMRNGEEIKSPLLALLSKFVITYKVDNDGELKDVLGYDKVLEAAKSQYSEGVAENLSSMLNIDALKQRDFSEWNGRIGYYLNKEFSIGDVWEYEAPYTLPNGVKLNYKVRTLFKKLVLHKNVKCVLIEQTYGSTGEGIADLANDVVKSVSKEDDKTKNATFKVSDTGSSVKGKATRIIDPSTMTIYKEDVERTIHMEMDVPGAGQIPVKMIETRSYEYDYQ